MAPLSHPNLVKLYGGCWNDGPDKLCIVLEFCSEGSLNDLLKRCASSNFNWANPFHRIISEIAACFVYLHHEQATEALIHRDLKPDNVLIADGLVAKVADFGESRRFDSNQARKRSDEDREIATMTMVGTPLYC